MARFYRKFWHRRTKNQGIFGGKIASLDEVKALNKSINDKEASEFQAFEEEFDKQLNDL